MADQDGERRQSENRDWEKRRVQRAVDYHNKCNGTAVEIVGLAIDVDPHLADVTNWDWTCRDKETGKETAIEVKRITSEKLEAKAQELYDLLSEVRSNLLQGGYLPGEFVLFARVTDDYVYPFRGKPHVRKRYIDVITEVIAQRAHTIPTGTTVDVTPDIEARLGLALPVTVFFDLHKLNDTGELLVIERLTDVDDLVDCGDKLEQLVSHANAQLAQAKTKETILVLIEEGLMHAEPDELSKVFEAMDCSSYYHIKFVYFVRGEKVAEIQLPEDRLRYP